MRPRFVPYTRCRRCGLASKSGPGQCTHCDHLSEYEVQLLKEEHERQQIGQYKLGYKMLLCAVIMTGLLLLALSG